MRFTKLTKLFAAGAATLFVGGLAPAAANACPYADVRPTPSTSASAEQRAYDNFLTGLRAAGAVTCLTNLERTNRGLPALVKNRSLTYAAEQHTMDMVNRGYFAHMSPEGRRADFRIRNAGYCTSCWWAENIYRGSGTWSTPRAAVRWWMNSPGHRANILNPRFKDTGVGVVPFATGYTGQAATYTQLFGSLT